jgi:5S rRNA maturation endonuclease (ribonuclease M5)
MKVRTRKLGTDKLDSLLSTLGEFAPRKEWLNFHCPFHHGGKLNFGVNVSSNTYYCFACGERGTLPELYDRLQEETGDFGPGLLHGPSPLAYEDDTAPSASKRLSDPALTAPPGPVRPGLRPEQFDTVYKQLKCHRPETILEGKALSYLNRRGVDMHEYEVGLIDTDEFRCRVIFPIRQEGKVVFFQGRSFYDIPLKTKNPNEDCGWTGKSSVLWNYDNLAKNICVCEGIFDAISVQTGLSLASTCLLGSTVSIEQIRLLKKKGVKEVVVFLDNDANGAAVDLALVLYRSGFKVQVVLWPEHPEKKDPGSIDRSEMADLLQFHSQVVTPASIVTLPLVYA